MKKAIYIVLFLLSSVFSFAYTETEEVLAYTLYSEARSEGEIGIRACASVIYNRKHQRRWSKLSYIEICKQRKQFSCWNKGYYKPQPKGYSDKAALNICFKVASEIVNNNFKPTVKANHYLVDSLKVSSTHWKYQMKDTVKIGAHLFGTL